MNTTGRRRTPAKLSASCQSERLVAPSPDQPERDARLALDAERQRAAARHRHHRRQVRDHRDQPEPQLGHVDVAVAAGGRARRRGPCTGRRSATARCRARRARPCRAGSARRCRRRPSRSRRRPRPPRCRGPCRRSRGSSPGGTACARAPRSRGSRAAGDRARRGRCGRGHPRGPQRASRRVRLPGQSPFRVERSALRLGNVPAAIEIEALVKRYGGHVALDGVTLRVPVGTVYGFLGPNGAGKTTTMRILLGLLRADAGTARVLGHDPWSDGLAGARPRSATCPPAPACTGGCAAASSSTTSADSTAPRRCRGDELCDALRLATPTSTGRCAATRRACARSSAIIQALQHDPALAVLDEPTEGLDPLVQDGFVEILTARRGSRTHELPLLARAVGDRGALRPGGHHPRRQDRGRGHDRRAARRSAAPGDGARSTGRRRSCRAARWCRRRRGAAVYAHHGPLPDLLRALAALDPRDVRIEEPGLDEVFRGLYDARDDA